jgi:pimeloyl-ACP methyl ester carboxylesterase
MRKPRLLILSDLFGGENPEWMQYYKDILKSNFDIQYYDVLQLAGISSDCDETNIHNQFLNGGIDKATENLLELETDEVIVLGFSIGGTIAWKASLKGLNVSLLIAVSSTRLRFENEVPNCKIKLYFGERDLNKPDSKWFSDLKISSEILDNQNHQFYLQQNKAFVICNNLK